MNRGASHGLILSSVIINKLNIRWARIILPPPEANPPLSVDPYGILPFPIPLENFQTIGVERSKVSQRCGGVKNAQALFGLVPERLPSTNPLAGRESFRVSVTVAPNQSAGLIHIIDE